MFRNLLLYKNYVIHIVSSFFNSIIDKQYSHNHRRYLHPFIIHSSTLAIRCGKHYNDARVLCGSIRGWNCVTAFSKYCRRKMVYTMVWVALVSKCVLHHWRTMWKINQNAPRLRALSFFHIQTACTIVKIIIVDLGPLLLSFPKL